MYYYFDTDELDGYLDELEYQSSQSLYMKDEIDFAARRRLVRDLMPRNLRGVSPNITHWWKVANIRNKIRRWFPGTQIRVDKDRRERGKPVTKKRPDIQFRHPQRHRATHVEVDTERRSMNQHIAERDHTRRGVFVLIDGNTGRVIEKQIFPAGSTSPLIRYGELSRRDVFDEYDSAVDYGWWDDTKRFFCKLDCARIYGEGCRNGCGFDSACISECNRKLYECNTDCERRYP